MKLYKSPLAIGIFLAITLSGLLYHVKYKVVDIESTLRQINNDIYKTEESIHVLKAELAYHLTPSSIQKLSARFMPNDPYVKTTYLNLDDLDALPDYKAPTQETKLEKEDTQSEKDKTDVR